MYDASIIDRNLSRFKRLNRTNPIPLTRQTPEASISRSQAIHSLYDEKKQALLRDLTNSESEFIRSEMTLCRYDFRYFAERYGTIQLDANVGGGMAAPKLWATQERALTLLAAREVEMWKQYDEEKFCDGILAALHKARQQGMTAFWCQIKMHRMIFYTNTRALSATLAMPNDSSKLELYNRDQIILNALPFFMRPKIKFEVKGEQLQFDGLGSKLIYTDSMQRSGIGTGAQWDVHQITECGLWDNLLRLMFELMPGVPKSPFVIGGWESTANGRTGPGEDWMTLTENIRHRRRGWEHWVYCFIPWYTEPTKYRRPVPSDWVPSKLVVDHAEMVEKTSPEFNGGVAYRLTRPQMYWWESEHSLYQSLNKLNQFLTNYCATPEESFQHSLAGALPHDVLERIHHEATVWGAPYDVSYKEMVKI